MPKNTLYDILPGKYKICLRNIDKCPIFPSMHYMFSKRAI